MEKGKRKIGNLIYRLIDNKKHIRNIGPYLLPGIVIRRVTKNAQKNNYNVLQVDKVRCSKCMICVNNCPTKSIIFFENEFRFLNSCTACMRCYNFCPKYAICHEGEYADPSIYRRYKGPILESSTQ